ncbi:bidirectional sugar transporter SWEET13-like [Eucalyptus grandis]|uniref:bidirectional sugar transporter SWEET13-like n=1 Tax=Eucalyptus grandis TaxID=71139 RepID=UPI00192EBDBB|nr:bidirectional sugar transporter SWEET13-like [Eucalyptus grandis]
MSGVELEGKTFYKIYKEKSSEGHQSIPYVVVLLSALLQLYYEVLKANDTMTIIIINASGIVIELVYLVLFSIYASTEEKEICVNHQFAQIYTAKLMLLFDIGGFGVTMALTILLLKGQHRVNVVGWIYATFSLMAFTVPLSIMWRVIKTRSVEFMSFTTSLLVTLSAITWFFYGLVVKDLNIAVSTI